MDDPCIDDSSWGADDAWQQDSAGGLHGIHVKLPVHRAEASAAAQVGVQHVLAQGSPTPKIERSVLDQSMVHVSTKARRSCLLAPLLRDGN